MPKENDNNIKKRFFYRGVELAKFCAVCEGLGRYVEISEFYGALVENAYTWFCESRYLQIIEEYDSCPDAQKKFGGIIRYEYLMRVGIDEEDENYLVILCEVCMQKHNGEKIFEFSDRQRWDKKLCIMVRKKRKEK